MNRQVSNVSDDTPQSRTRPKLSLNANTFFIPSESKVTTQATSQEEAKQKTDNRIPLAKQGSIQSDQEKKINMSDYNSQTLSK